LTKERDVEDTLQTDPSPEVSIDDRLSRFLDSSDEGSEPEAEASSQESQPQAEEAAPAAEEPAAAEEPTEEIKWNGEIRRLTKAELRDLAEKGFDYTQKTTSLAEQRRAFEAQQQQAEQLLAAQLGSIDQLSEIRALDNRIAAFKDTNWIELADQDPVQYLKLNQAYRDLKEAREAKVSEFQQAQQFVQQQKAQSQAEYLAKEKDRLTNAIPEFGKDFKGTSEKLKSYLTENGFKAEEVGGVSDHRALVLAWKAMQFDALKAKAAETTKKVADLPKVVKPGAAPQSKTAQQSADYQKLRQQLKKTGKAPPGLMERFL
jgi:hypothetical protein